MLVVYMFLYILRRSLMNGIDFLWLVTCFLLPKHGIVSIYACRFLFCLKSHIIVTSSHLLYIYTAAYVFHIGRSRIKVPWTVRNKTIIFHFCGPTPMTAKTPLKPRECPAPIALTPLGQPVGLRNRVSDGFYAWFVP